MDRPFTVTTTSNSSRTFSAVACTAVASLSLLFVNNTPISVMNRQLHDNAVYQNVSLENHTNNCISMNTLISSNEKDIWKSLNKINLIASLEDNWNGNGASKFSENLIESSKSFVKELPYQPFIAPTANNSIQMEYENPEGDYLEFELFENSMLKMFVSKHDGASKTRMIDQKRAIEEIESFYGYFVFK